MTRSTASEIQSTAANWFARVLSGDATAGELGQLEAWLEADARHRGAFVRTQAMWAFLDPSVETPTEQAPAFEEALERPAGQGRHYHRRALLGGAVAIAASIAAFHFLPDALFAEHQSFVTSRGETKASTLSDGSQIVLDGGSHVETVMKRHERRVRLVSGEGWFHVAKDKSRPFVVAVNGVTVTAVGTAFSVGKSDRILVVVSDGVVQIASSDGEAVPVHRNQTALIVGNTIRVTTLDEEDVRRRLAWREGYIAFDGETLAQAVASFNRFNAEQLIIADTALGNRRVAGWFSRSDPVGFAEASATMLGGNVRRVNGQITLSRK
jgi:transmembrane sensor